MNRFVSLLIATAVAVTAQGSGPALDSAAASATNAAVNQLLDQIVEREHAFIESMHGRAPLIETYIQETSAESDGRPDKDHYFLGRLRLGDSVTYEKLLEHSDPAPKAGFKPPHGAKTPMTFLPRGFAQMTVIDLHDFNRATYSFDYIRREFLGEVRCLVFDVAPLHREEAGRFTGRVWVEDRDNNVVRFDGIYAQGPTPKGAAP
jgi:hypothetical protein